MASEKDEAVAKWAGFTRRTFTGLPPQHSWLDPDGRVVAAPDFTDMTTLFKWCVPKLDSYALNGRAGVDEACVFVGPASVEWVKGSTPGEALRNAILALIAPRNPQ